MSDNQYKYSIRFTKKEKARYEELAEKRGKRTLSKLIREALNTVARNPALLEPTEDKSDEKMLEAFEKSFSVFDQLSETLQNIEKRLDTLERFQEFTAKKLGASKLEVKALQQKDSSGEVIFDDE